MKEDTFDSLYEENLEQLVIKTCRRVHDRITDDVSRKYLLKDEHYFQAEIYRDLLLVVRDLDPNLKVKMEYRPDTMSRGHVDIVVIDQSEPLDQDILYINVGRRTKQSNANFAEKILQMATLSLTAPTIFILVTDGREMADLRLPNNVVLDKKRKMVFKDTVAEILDARDDFDYYMNRLTNRLNLKETVPDTFQLELLRSFSFGKREKERFAITVWSVDGDIEPEMNETRPGSGSTFLTELSESGRSKETYKLMNRLWASKEFDVRRKKMAYVHSELVIRSDNRQTDG